MNEIYVIGHHNPDTDSIVSAMAYAALRNALGDRNYVAAHMDHISDQTQRMLDRFGFQPPRTVQNVRTQVEDLDYDTPPALNATVTMDRAWHIMREQKISAIPVINEDGTLYGTLSAGDIATYSMTTIANPRVEAVPLFNLLSVIEGRLLNDSGDLIDTVSGNVVIALPQSCENLLFGDPDNIVICGDQPDMIRRALDIGVSCLILCQTEVDPDLLENAGRTCIITTPYEASRVARLIYQASPISRPCHNEKIVCFHLTDYIDDVREVVLKSRYRCYPVLDENEKVVGTLSRYHLLRPRRKRVVLVDHNERAQAVPGLDQAEILEIIDHHRLADIQTSQPIRVRNEPVGSTATIIAGMYQEHGVMPSANMAGLLAAAILADTVMFKSPTCTKRDIAMAERMARIGGVNIKELGRQLFSTAGGKSVEELVSSDFKEFHIGEQNLGVGQVTCLDSMEMLERNGVSCRTCIGAKDVVGELRKEPYDLLLTDIQMHGTSGFDLLYLLRHSNIGNSRTIPVAAMTARNDVDESRYTEAGFSGCIQKPFSMNELQAFLSSIMERSGQRQEQKADFNALAAETGDMEWMLNAFIEESIDNRTELKKALESMKTDTERMKNTLHRMYPTWEQLGVACELETYSRILHDDTSDDLTISTYTETVIGRIDRLVGDAKNLLSEIRKLDLKNYTDETQNTHS